MGFLIYRIVNFIKTYEGFEVGNFKTFLDKYRKKGYISRTDMKRMDSTDLKSEYFNRINNRVESCINFFNNTDFDLLSDLMIDVYDEFPTIDSLKVNYHFNILVEDKTTISSITNIPVSIMGIGPYSFDSRFWDPNVNKYHRELRSKEDIIESIISIVESRKRQMANAEETKKREFEKRPGFKDPWSSYQLKTLTYKNPYQNLIINPVLTLDIRLDGETSSNPYSDMDFGWGTPGANEKYQIMADFKKMAEPQLKRYFSAIGYDSYFSISSDANYSNNMFLRFNIAVS